MVAEAGFKKEPLRLTDRPTIRLFLPFVLLLCLCAAMVVFIVSHTVNEANRIDRNHAESRIQAALVAESERMTMLANDNALWDEAVQGVYGPSGSAFFWSSWGAPTAEAPNYNVAMVLDQSGRTLVAFEDGKASDPDMMARFGPSLGALLAKAAVQQKATGGYVRDKARVYVAGTDNIMPIDRSLEALIPKTGPHRLVLLKRLDEDHITKLGNQAGLPGIRLNPLDGEGLERTQLTDVSGKPLAVLGWKATLPGWQALRSGLSAILFGLVLAVVLATMVMRAWMGLIRKLHGEARTDSLSGLPNRRALRSELSALLAGNQPVALAMLDLDGFKAVNDRFGHLAGDRLINEVAILLEATVGPGGRIARLGGDEFAIALVGDQAEAQLERHASELIGRFTSPFRIDDRTVAVGVSIGLARRISESLTASELMRRADVALYAAKRAGKMRCRRYSEALDDAQARARSIECDLRTALENDEFSLVYQPLFDHAGERIRAVEALLRWHRPYGEPVEPSEFIPIAEYSGLIDKIGLWVVRRACSDGLRWGDVSIAVNLSSAQLANPELPRLLQEVLDETGFPPIRLELEISERFLAGDMAQARRIVDELRQIGVSVVLDEYGSGHSSIGFLRTFNFSKIKVDRTVSADAAESDVSRTVIQANIAVARALGMAVTVAGIETEEQAELMRVSGCDELQGWHLSGELTLAEMDALLARNRDKHQARA